jgi:hypothetical protein
MHGMNSILGSWFLCYNLDGNAATQHNDGCGISSLSWHVVVGYYGTGLLEYVATKRQGNNRE